MSNTDKYTRVKKWDWILWCDICGTRCWGSEATRLNVYTGRGGLMVCPDCNDPIDYGLVPYKVPAEKPVPIIRDASQAYNPNSIYTQAGSFPYQQYDPATTNPQTIISGYETWDQLNYFIYNNWQLPWGTNLTPDQPP
jgi:hypothetical protein